MAEFKVSMIYKKATKNTFVFEAEKEGAPIPMVYIAKSAFEDKEAPHRIQILVQKD